MAAYPDIPQSYDSKRVVINGTVVDTADDGTPWIRDFYAQAVYQFTLVHSLITLTDAQTIESFYAANKTGVITLVYQKDLVTYSCYFTGPPQMDRSGTTLWDVQVQLMGSKA